MKVAIDEIVGVDQPSASTPQNRATTLSPSVTVTSQGMEAAGSEEINVIGLRVEQAVEIVDKFLDQATLAHRGRVRIIHGHGTGALRKGLAEFLKSHPLVARSSAEHPDRGGNAITVVELRS